MTDRGCPRGDQCTYTRPRKQGKCLRCGGVSHDLSTCRRPARDPKLNPPKNNSNNAKGSGFGGKGHPPPKAKNQPKNTSRGGANAVWACGEIIEDNAGGQVASASASMATLHPINSLHITDDPDYPDINATACTFYTTFLPTFLQPTPMSTWKITPRIILDTGAAHCLMLLSWLGEAECELAKRIHLKVATGSTVRALLYNNVIYA